MLIAFLIAAFVIAIILFVFYKEKTSPVQQTAAAVSSKEAEQSVPDSAVSFGYKCMWFAVKTTDKKRLAELLQLSNVSECNWRVGISKAYEGSVFISPPVDGWTLACGWGLPYGDSKESIAEVKKTVQLLSKEFGDAQFFCTHRVTEYHCWIKAKNGQVERVYSFSGESGENIIEGEPTAVEQKMKLINTLSAEAKDDAYYEREDIVWPNEETVMKIAKHWSVDPSVLEMRTDIAPALGLLGKRMK